MLKGRLQPREVAKNGGFSRPCKAPFWKPSAISRWQFKAVENPTKRVVASVLPQKYVSVFQNHHTRNSVFKNKKNP